MGGRWAVALLGVATAIPAAAISAVVLTGGSDAGVLQLSSPSGTLPVLPHRNAAATVGAAEQRPTTPPRAAGPEVTLPTADRTPTAAARGDLRTLAPGAQVGTADGRLRFVAPQGWLYGACPQGGDSCVEIAPVGLGGGDAIDVLVTAQAAGDTSTGTATGGVPAGEGAVTVAGRPAQRLDLRSNASVLVVGAMPQPGSRFMVSCRYASYETLLRQACDQVVRTLQIAAA